ncbi:manganese catalase family protein [Domibacillus tundrae]|uniref:manganese catalase family protein n=1 Tax=Domibacillus tundrae TaxID=1587527 RepID=UPI003EBE568A
MESQSRWRVCQLYNMTTDRCVRDMLFWLITRDTMYQHQWIDAVKELKEEENIVVPSTFPRQLEKREVFHTFLIFQWKTKVPLADRYLDQA